MDGIVRGAVPLGTGTTLYARLGDWLPVGCWARHPPRGVRPWLIVRRPARPPRPRSRRVRPPLGRSVLVVGYVVICLVMWLLENRLVFYPVAATELWNDPPDPAIQDVYLPRRRVGRSTPGGCPPGPGRRLVLFCPGTPAT